MNSEKRLHIYNIISILCGVWFLLLGWFWTYYANIVIAYPFAIIGFFLWRSGRNARQKVLNKIAGYLLLTGLIISIVVLFVLLIFG